MMVRISWFRVLALSALAALSTGCASIKMVSAKSTKVVPAGKVLVTFVRQSVWMGDGIPVDLWDGTHYIGVLGPGTIVQYETTPGDHLFLARAENWTYATGSLIEGKRYYLKANIFPGALTVRAALGVADRSDTRIDEWHKWHAKAAPEAARTAFEAKGLAKAQEAIELFKGGGVEAFASIKEGDAF